MHMFLATVRKEVYEEMDYDECFSTGSSDSYGGISKFTLSRVVDTSDSIVAEELQIEKDIVLDYGAFDGDPDTVLRKARYLQSPLNTDCYYQTVSVFLHLHSLVVFNLALIESFSRHFYITN